MGSYDICITDDGCDAILHVLLYYKRLEFLQEKRMAIPIFIRVNYIQYR
jgi:hypothetical protein